jgi:hypothetical protein
MFPETGGRDDLPRFQVYQVLVDGLYCHFKFPKLEFYTLQTIKRSHSIDNTKQCTEYEFMTL